MKRYFLFSFFTFILTSIFLSAQLQLKTLYGYVNLEDELIIDLLQTKAVQRMKNIDQSGISRYFDLIPPYSRYDHSIGVYYLLKKFNAPLKEQAAGLIHDVSHTAFSHLGDMIFDHDESCHQLSYQDSIHDWYLNKSDIKDVLDKHHLRIADLTPKNEAFKALEQDLPDICADRLEYNLHTGYICHLITQDDIREILNDLHFEENCWFFSKPSIAKKFARLSLYFTDNIWGSAWHLGIYKTAAQAFKRALNLKILTFDDLHFSTDYEVLNKLKSKPDTSIQESLEKCAHHKKFIHLGNEKNFNFYIKPKFRGINPWIKINHNFYRLTALDSEFASEYSQVKKKSQKGHYLILR